MQLRVVCTVIGTGGQAHDDHRLTPHQRMQLAVGSCKALTTIERIYRGCVATTTTRAAVERAARELGLPLPPPASPASRLAEAS